MHLWRNNRESHLIMQCASMTRRVIGCTSIVRSGSTSLPLRERALRHNVNLHSRWYLAVVDCLRPENSVGVIFNRRDKSSRFEL